jgi:uncharacterized protein (TIGR00369 family)
MVADMEHTDTRTWIDPDELAALRWRIPGLDFCRLLVSSELAAMPLASTLGIAFTVAEPGRAEVRAVAGEHLGNVFGTMHGGVVTTLLDTAAGCALHTTLPPGVGYTTLDLSVRFLRPVLLDNGTVRAAATLVNRGRRTALVTAELRDAADRLLAHATCACMLFPADG